MIDLKRKIKAFIIIVIFIIAISVAIKTLLSIIIGSIVFFGLVYIVLRYVIRLKSKPTDDIEEIEFEELD